MITLNIDDFQWRKLSNELFLKGEIIRRDELPSHLVIRGHKRNIKYKFSACFEEWQRAKYIPYFQAPEDEDILPLVWLEYR